MERTANHIERLKVTVHGAVQGVGFRPFVFRLSSELGLFGWVLNSPDGVYLEVEGSTERLKVFLRRLQTEKPPHASVHSLESTFLDPVGYAEFVIRQSEAAGEKSAIVLPDIGTCPDCLREILDPGDRRYLYPFTNCTNCGPRFTIIESLPYDRANTTMKAFAMCEECRREYEDPRNRRFHAQPNACPKCGPHLELWDGEGRVLAHGHLALQRGADCIRRGGILALKGLGGFHLMVDARNDEAVNQLRLRKHREEKPFALMYPSLELVHVECEVSELEERVLLSPESPIVLLERKAFPQVSDGKPSLSPVSPSVAPANPYLGVMLPYTPLHHILMRELDFPLVATSGNLSDEPICIDEHEALGRLREVADMFLVHNRPIVRHVDDSIVRTMAGRELVIRRARGYAPLPFRLAKARQSSALAVGAHLKNTIAMTSGKNVFISQHIGDLETNEAFEAFKKVIVDFQQLYEKKPDVVMYDLHPDYLSTKHAQECDAELHGVQHHYAHVASCMAENELQGRALGVSWDGTGYGLDGTIWGGEFLLTNETSFERAGFFRHFRLPGGEISIKEPRRAALGLLFEILGDQVFERQDLLPLRSFTTAEQNLLHQMLHKGINSPLTSSVGRLFDAVASLLGLRQRVRFEGQAAMELEFSVDRSCGDETYPFETSKSPSLGAPIAPIVVDWSGLVLGILNDQRRGIPVGTISAKFHHTLSEIIVSVAEEIGESRVVLTGGCFQNKVLTEGTVRRLRARGFRPYWHQRVPPNDGGIALGQINAFMRMKAGAVVADRHREEEVVK